MGCNCLVSTAALPIKTHYQEKTVMFHPTIANKVDVTKEKNAIFKYNRLSMKEKLSLYSKRPDLNLNDELTEELIKQGLEEEYSLENDQAPSPSVVRFKEVDSEDKDNTGNNTSTTRLSIQGETSIILSNNDKANNETKHDHNSQLYCDNIDNKHDIETNIHSDNHSYDDEDDDDYDDDNGNESDNSSDSDILSYQSIFSLFFGNNTESENSSHKYMIAKDSFSTNMKKINK